MVQFFSFEVDMAITSISNVPGLMPSNKQANEQLFGFHLQQMSFNSDWLPKVLHGDKAQMGRAFPYQVKEEKGTARITNEIFIPANQSQHIPRVLQGSPHF